MSTGPSVASTSRTARSISRLCVTSSLKPSARLPPRRISPAVSSTCSFERAQQATAAPAAPSASAMARPIPRLAPVTRATRPFTENQSRIHQLGRRPSVASLSLTSWRSRYFWIFPLGVMGNSETISRRSGNFCFASCLASR